MHAFVPATVAYVGVEAEDVARSESQLMPGARPSCMRTLVPASRQANAQAWERSRRPWRTIASNREPTQLPERESVTAAPELVSRVATQQIVTETHGDVVGE